MSQASGPKPRRRFHAEDVAILQDALATGQQNYEPRNSSKSMRGLLSEVRRDILALRRRGFTVTTIAAMIHEGGFSDLAPSTLRRYVSEASASKRRRAVKPSNLTASLPPPQATANPAPSSAAPVRGAEFPVIPDREDL